MAGRFSVLSDLDGVLHRGSRPLPGCRRFVRDLLSSGRKYLFLTNSPDHSPAELRKSLKKLGMDIPESCIHTSAQTMASFLRAHGKRPKVYMVGSRALHDALAGIGAQFTDRRPDYVVFASGGSYGIDEIDKAIELVAHGAKFITASDEKKSLTENGIKAGCGAIIAPIESATGCKAYVVGKPNHLMIRNVEREFGINPLETLMIGDSLDTDIDVGEQAQMTTVLVLSGITSREQLKHSAYEPDYVFENVGCIKLGELP
jgi:NagD protein